ncbi:MAG: PA14 domain-containing protein [Bacteroidota bacterium]
MPFSLFNGLAGLLLMLVVQVAPAQVFSQKGLNAEYFNTLNLTKPVLTQRDLAIDFNWKNAAPVPGVNADTFSVRWRGYVVPKFSQTYTFTVQSGNGYRLWVNETLLIDHWAEDGKQTGSATLALTAGVQYYLKMEYAKRKGTSRCQLEWASPSQVKQVIPASQLIPEGAELPPVKIMTNTIGRDPQVTLGPDNQYYMIHTSCYLKGDLDHANCWDHNDGLHLWKSSDMDSWTDMGLIWSIERDGTWQKKFDEKNRRPLWAPEIRYIQSKKNWYITYSMGTFAPIGIKTGLFRSTTGRPEGPYVDVVTGPIIDGIDGSLFEDTDGSVYFLHDNCLIAKMNSEMTGFTEPFRVLKTQSGKPVGFEGSGMIKVNGRYYAYAATANKDMEQETYDLTVSVSDSVYGPYSEIWLGLRHGGHSTLFFNRENQLWCTMFGSDNISPIYITPTLVRLIPEVNGKLLPWRGDARMDVVVPIASGSWRYTTTVPPTGWQTNGFSDKDWAEGSGGFGTNGQTPWTTNDIWLRKTFNPGNLSLESLENMLLAIQQDDYADVYINGKEVYRYLHALPNYQLKKISKEIRSSIVRNSNNILAIHCHQVDKNQFIDAGLIGWTGLGSMKPPAISPAKSLTPGPKGKAKK